MAQRRLERPVSNRPTLRNILPTMRNGAAIALMAAAYSASSFLATTTAEIGAGGASGFGPRFTRGAGNGSRAPHP
jgi:hypothetical protein